MCSFWVGGTCNRVTGGSCPFRPCCGVHKFPELASTEPELCQELIEKLDKDGAAKVMISMGDEIRAALRHSVKGGGTASIRNRYNGVKDQLSEKYMGKMEAAKMMVPDDTSITSLWVGGLMPGMTSDDLKDAFYHYGELRSIRVVAEQRCAFVEYTTREDAEKAAEGLYRNLTVKGQRLQLSWSQKSRLAGADVRLQLQGQSGQGQGQGQAVDQSGNEAFSSYTLPAPGMKPGQAVPALPAGFAASVAAEPATKRQKTAAGGLPPPPPPPQNMSYPSMDPQRLGTRVKMT